MSSEDVVRLELEAVVCQVDGLRSRGIEVERRGDPDEKLGFPV